MVIDEEFKNSLEGKSNSDPIPILALERTNRILEALKNWKTTKAEEQDIPDLTSKLQLNE